MAYLICVHSRVCPGSQTNSRFVHIQTCSYCSHTRTISAPGDYPTHIEVHPHSEHSVLVKWRGVTTHFDEESLDGYIVSILQKKKTKKKTKKKNFTTRDSSTDVALVVLQMGQAFESSLYS